MLCKNLFMTPAPVVGITRNPFLKKHFLECDVFQIAKNVNKYLGYFSKKICCQELSNNRPIRSHCAPTQFPSLKLVVSKGPAILNHFSRRIDMVLNPLTTSTTSSTPSASSTGARRERKMIALRHPSFP